MAVALNKNQNTMNIVHDVIYKTSLKKKSNVQGKPTS